MFFNKFKFYDKKRKTSLRSAEKCKTIHDIFNNARGKIEKRNDPGNIGFGKPDFLCQPGNTGDLPGEQHFCPFPRQRDHPEQTMPVAIVIHADDLNVRMSGTGFYAGRSRTNEIISFSSYVRLRSGDPKLGG